MTRRWIRENPPHWDNAKERLLASLPDGIFDLPDHSPRDLLPGEWWRVEQDGEIAAYGWMDTTWGDAEILLAVAPHHQGQGLGTYILDRLEEEAAARGLNYLYNTVAASHPDRARVSAWLRSRGFEESGEGGLLRRRARRLGPRERRG